MNRSHGRPSQILALDIETDVPAPKQAVDLCVPFLLGFKIFSVDKFGIHPGAYQHVGEKGFRHAIQVIGRFRGPIVGYNLLGFDLVLLRELGGVAGFFRRTVDLLDFLARKVGQRRGLRLGRVCEEIIGEGKDTRLRSSLAELWESGQRHDVLRYNDRDLDLTARLWHRLVTASSVQLGGRKLTLTASDRAFLYGRRPSLTYEAWIEREFVSQNFRVRSDRFQGLHLNPIDLAYAYDRYICKTTGEPFFTRLVRENEYPSGEDIRPRHCPVCKDYVWHSPYAFKVEPAQESGPVLYGRAKTFLPTRAGAFATSAEKANALWTIIQPHLSTLDIGHFAVEGVPRLDPDDAPHVEASYSEEDVDFERWLRGVRRVRELQQFMPRFRTVVTYTTRRGMEALQREAMKYM